jgi:hypothetical protein
MDIQALRTGVQRHGQAPALFTAAWVLLGLLVVADGRLGLSGYASGRYRAHAIPVALSQMYHGRPHDYTAHLDIAAAFHGPEPLDDLVARFADPATPVGEGTHFWTADDRGLSDYVCLAFRLFGPRSASLANLYFALLAASLLVFTLAHRRDPAALFLPVLALLGLLAYAHTGPHYAAVVLGDGEPWKEPVGLFDSRMFESVAILAWLHLALLAWRPAGPAAWLAAVPQAALLLFLYHARSSLGWMYLSLFVLAGTAVVARLRVARRGGIPPGGLTRPLVIAGLLAVSLGGLALYKRAAYHPAYFADHGARTFWHNALMGYSYHPKLRAALDIGIDDTRTILLVIRDMEQRGDPRLTPEWTLAKIGGSLNPGKEFNWREYERSARHAYFGVWRRTPGRAIACYAWYKPRDLASHTRQLAGPLAADLRSGRANLLAIGLAVVAVLLPLGWWAVRRDPAMRAAVRELRVPLVCLLAFSTIPAIAFYAAIPTLSGFYMTLPVCLGVFALSTLTAPSVVTAIPSEYETQVDQPAKAA